MSKLDSKKELLTVFRTLFGLAIAIIITVSAGIINMYYLNRIDILFYIGAFFVILVVITLPFIAKYIIKTIKEIEEL